MSLPSNVQTGTVVGKFLSIKDGTPITGSVTFTPSFTKALDATATPPVTLLPEAVSATLDEDGAFSIVLAATDDPDLGLGVWTWSVSFGFASAFPVGGFPIAVPSGDTVDLTLTPPAGQANGALLVEGIPTGGADGQVLTKSSSANYDTEWADPTGGGSGATTLGGLTDVTTTGVVSGQVLKYNGTEWAPGTDNTGGGSGSVAWDDVTDKPAFVASGTTAAAARTVIGAGTSDLALGTTSTTAKAGDYEPDWGDVGSKPAVIAAGADQATARSAIGAGTSDLAIGTTGSTAMAGNKTAADLGGIVTDVTGIPGAFALPNVVGISATDYAALTDPETTYPDVAFLVLS